VKVGLIPAAGLAQRLGITTPKELLLHEGQAIIDYSIDLLFAAGVGRIVIVIRQGKEAIREHVEQKYNGFSFEFVYQTGEIGRLIDAIKAAQTAIKGHDVYFCMADTQINPFHLHLSKELALLCFRASGDEWRHFGVVDTEARHIVDKPAEFVSDVCWGALVWRPQFTQRIMAASDLTAVMNQADWDYKICIDVYKDIGI
jgi:NDP-sugar pyrophosphorylase family protein